MSDQVIIFDTTLRDGEQCPGASMNLREKMEIARQLARVNVDVIEAGFPVISDGDFEAVKTIATEIQGPIICGLARCVTKDIEAAAAAVKPAGERGRVHVFLATSAIHREFKLKKAEEEIIRLTREGVSLAKRHTRDVEFSPEDASRTELEFLAEVVTAVIAAGATTINVPDTVGYSTPQEYAEIFQYLKQHVAGIDAVVLSVHCHDDLGMAVANSLSAVHAGARQIECTINGIGERAGNCSLEEVAMALKTREGFYGLHTGIQTTRLSPTSRLLSTTTGMLVPRNKAIVGENAFAHESGIHQHGMLKHHSTYEIMRPHDVGLSRTNLVLGKHSGRHAFRDRVKDLGFELSEEELNRAFTEFKALADKKKELFDGDIEAIVLRTGDAGEGPWSLVQLWASATSGEASAVVRLVHTDGREVEQGATGDGPVDAVFKAIERATGTPAKLVTFDVHAMTEGEDALGESIVNVEYNERSYRGVSLSTNILESSANAFIECVNRIQSSRSEGRRTHAQLSADASTVKVMA